VSTVTWNATTEKDDAWWDFLAERQELTDFIAANAIHNVVFVSGDIHSGGAIDNGDNAGFPEISLPSANLNPDATGAATCNLHYEPTRSRPGSCGIWSEGYLEHGSGFGLLTLTPDTLQMETRNQLGQSLSLAMTAAP